MLKETSSFTETLPLTERSCIIIVFSFTYKLSVTVFLINGVKLQGIITWFDNFSILLKRDSHIQLVYKHSISTIMPAESISIGIDTTE